MNKEKSTQDTPINKEKSTQDTRRRVPRGIRNNNPLNIRKGNNWIGERKPQTDPDFEEFTSMEFGLRAAFILLRNYIQGKPPAWVKYNTINKIIRRWAPETENATQRYIDFVAKDTGIDARQVISFSDRKMMVAIVSAMAMVECGVRLDPQVIESAYDMI